MRATVVAVVVRLWRLVAEVSRLPWLSVRHGVCLLLDWLSGWLVDWLIHSFTHSEKQPSRVVEGRALGERVHPGRPLLLTDWCPQVPGLSALSSVSSLKRERLGPA